MLVQGDKTDSTEGERVTIPGGPGYLMLSAYEFKPYNTETSFAYSGFVELYNPLSTEGYYVAPVNLPDHAVITQVVFYWWDTVSGVDSTLYLMANTAGSYSYWNIGTLYSSGYSGLGTTVLYMPPSSVEVDNSDTVYFLRLTLQGGYGYNLTLLQVRIDYAYSSYMPVIKK